MCCYFSMIVTGTPSLKYKNLVPLYLLPISSTNQLLESLAAGHDLQYANNLYSLVIQYRPGYLYSSSGPASMTPQFVQYWVVEFQPRTAAIRSLDSVPLKFI